MNASDMKKAVVWACAAGLVLGAASTAGAGPRRVMPDGRRSVQDVAPAPLVPPVWEHAGRILDSSGNPVTGGQTLEVRLYDAADGGNVVWGRQVPVLLDADGAFSVRLVDALPALDGAPDATLQDVLAAQPAWIECTVAGHPSAMAPRAAVGASPYALFADEAAGARENFDVAGSLRVLGETRTQNLTARDAASAGAVDVSGRMHVAGDAGMEGGLAADSLSGLGAVPVGTIILWYGEAGDVPDGWAVCDGDNGTPDMRGRFLVGAGNRYSPGDAGGAASVTLIADQMPAHSHGYELRDDGNRDAASGADCDDGVWHGDKTATSGSAGGGQPHENRPPYKAIHFIVRVG